MSAGIAAKNAGIERRYVLTDTQIRKTKPGEKPIKLTDAGGLHLYITPAGSKIWRWRYRFAGREKLLTIGHYPDMSLALAREERDRARRHLKAGKDPSSIKKVESVIGRRKEGETFADIAREWHALQKAQWVERHAQDVLSSLTDEVFPIIGDMLPAQIDAPQVLSVIRMIEQRGATETARRVRQRISAVFVYAIASGRASTDPASMIVGAMAPLVKGRQPAITNLEAAHAMLRKVEETPGHPVTKLAIRFTALTAVRPGTIASTPWAEFAELDAGQRQWIIPAARMKMKKDLKSDERRDHVVPLSDQAIETLLALRSLTGRGIYLFPNGRHSHKPMSENAMGYMINRAGYHQKHVPHGFRSTFSTIMNERFPADRAVIDRMLAHVEKDKVESAYNRAEHMRRRAELAQIWADLIMEGAPPAVDLLLGPRKILK